MTSKDMIINAGLKVCPFCGGTAVRFKSIRYPYDYESPYLVHGIMCANETCILHQSEKFFMTEEAAQIAWNSRKLD